MSHNLMILALVKAAESGPIRSKELSRSLRISPKYASMTLLRCFRRGFMTRRMEKCGKIREYAYRPTNKGAEWLFYKASQNKTKDTPNDANIVKTNQRRNCTPQIKLRRANQEPQNPHSIMPDNALLTMSTVTKFCDCEKRCQELEQQLNLAIYLIQERTEERDFTWGLYRQEREMNNALPKKHDPLETYSDSSDTDVSIRDLRHSLSGYRRGFQNGLSLGIEIGAMKMAFRNGIELEKCLTNKLENAKTKREAKLPAYSLTKHNV
jgi:hypothetical protein